MSSLLEHRHGENWKSPTRSFERSGKAKRTFRGTRKERFSLSQVNDVELARKLSWRENVLFKERKRTKLAGHKTPQRQRLFCKRIL